MSKIREFLGGLVIIEAQTESDRQNALAQIERSRRAFEQKLHPLHERSWMVKMAHGDFSLDSVNVKQANLRWRIVGLGSWTRNPDPFNSPDDFGEMLRTYRYV